MSFLDEIYVYIKLRILNSLYIFYTFEKVIFKTHNIFSLAYKQQQSSIQDDLIIYVVSLHMCMSLYPINFYSSLLILYSGVYEWLPVQNDEGCFSIRLQAPSAYPPNNVRDHQHGLHFLLRSIMA